MLTSQGDANWKQGYGFNNPNNDRQRQGLEPVNFDGKTDRERQKSNGGYFGNVFGDMVVYGCKSALTSVAASFRR